MKQGESGKDTVWISILLFSFLKEHCEIVFNDAEYHTWLIEEAVAGKIKIS